MNENIKVRWLAGLLAVTGLVIIFLFQRINVAGIFGVMDTRWSFIINRSIRFILNDTLAVILIFSLFYERKYVVFAVYVQLLGMLLILFPYFILKFNYPHYNGPLISFLHRLILNPTLILLLIPAFYYQKKAGNVL
jgi:exosortase F-associated protein